MADIEKVKQTLKYCADKPGWKCDRECLYSQNGERTAGTCWVNLNMDALSVIDGLKAELAELKDRHATIVEAADDMLAELKERRWIPVSERLPEDGSDILVYCNDGEESRIVACNYDNGVWFDCVFNTVMVFKNITHWMPLPEPPMMD